MTDILLKRLRSFGSLSWFVHANDKYEITLSDANMIVSVGKEAADEIERLRLSLSEARATGRREGLSEAAQIITDNCIMDTSSGKTLSPRQEGNRDGLHYAAAIRAAMEKAE